MLITKKSCVSLVLVFMLSVLGTVMMSSKVFAIGDATGTTASIQEIVSNQLADGGWRKYYTETSGDWGKSTIDNKATYTEIRRLAKAYKDDTSKSNYKAACIKGINFLLTMQYANGGWPQIYGGSGYHQAITYNDDAMINVMICLDEVSKKTGDFSFIDNILADKCKTAVTKGVDCLLNSQYKSGTTLQAWGQQHDKMTLKPTSARAYELASLCAKESVSIVKFLKTRNTTTAITASITAAQNWFKAVKITGINVVKANGDVTVVHDSSAPTIWARFYELGTNKAIFANRLGEVKYNLADIEKERRIGYSWYGAWPSSLAN
ncbi:pectate lyase [Clostridium estertheticum]|uniref:pectate lyase n=1 Tax=Clostridium estertheticum TaxID=238834 RepID=UPI001C0B78BF|nr:pectate lyase [Clostridium estertheticum]MBU3197699.1 pectate lyase [Clostridium estertheticum]WAG65503.1 pectate lyase [Clostridium estertheticum]